MKTRSTGIKPAGRDRGQTPRVERRQKRALEARGLTPYKRGGCSMDRRTFVKGTAAAVGASTLPAGRVFAQAAAPDKIRFGYAITQSGPLGPGADSTTISQYKLWQKRVNDGGGIMLKKFNKKVPVDFVSYDDQGKPDELLKLTERLIQQDKVDMMLAPYATHMNLAAAPIVTKHEYPVIMTTATTAKTYELG